MLDPTSGKVGGKLIWQGYGDPGGGRELIKIRNGGVLNLAGLTHDGLLEFAYGQPKYPGIGDEVLPVLAQALPEVSPDKLKVTFKLRPNVKWHNGKAFTSEDAKWTYDTLATAAESAWKNDHNWIEKTEAPDANTFVMTAKFPNADLLADIAFKGTPPIMERQHHESWSFRAEVHGHRPVHRSSSTRRLRCSAWRGTPTTTRARIRTSTRSTALARRTRRRRSPTSSRSRCT